MQRRRNMRAAKKSLEYLGFENKKGINSELYFIDSDIGYEKSDKPRVMKRKQEKKRRNLDKKPDKPYFRYKLHSVIDRDYELIRRFKKTNKSLHGSKVNLSEKNEMVYRDKGYFRQNQKVMTKK
jgi:IS5 family transposase